MASLCKNEFTARGCQLSFLCHFPCSRHSDDARDIASIPRREKGTGREYGRDALLSIRDVPSLSLSPTFLDFPNREPSSSRYSSSPLFFLSNFPSILVKFDRNKKHKEAYCPRVGTLRPQEVAVCFMTCSLFYQAC